MADTKISELAAAAALDGTELVPVVQDGDTVQTTAQDIADLAQSGSSVLVNTNDDPGSKIYVGPVDPDTLYTLEAGDVWLSDTTKVWDGTQWLPSAAYGFPPASISGLKLWLKADGVLWQDSARTIRATADGDPVGFWEDAAGLGGHATQATAGNRPTLKLSIVNSKPVLRFDGSSDRMASPASAAMKPFTAFAVAFHTGTILGASVAGGLHWRMHTTGVQEILKQDTVSIANDGGSALAAFTILAVTYSSTGAYALYRNGGSALASGTNNQTFTASSTTIGQNGSSGVELASGDIAEIIKYDSVLSAANMNVVGNYLETKYGVTWTDVS